MGSRNYPFSAIYTRDQDLLGRNKFVSSLASAIKDQKGKDSLVIALYGPWGSGKTSVKNMVLETLKESENPPHILEFNPWQWSGQKQVAEAFFDQIDLVLKRVNRSKKFSKRAASWRAYAAILKIVSLKPSDLSGLAAVAGLIGVGGSFIKIFWVRVITALLGIIGLTGYLVGKMSGVFAAWAEAHSKSLPEIKEEIANLLSELETPILVVIDDIDRLAPDEVKLLFQLIKANADFPNLIYLLLFQRNIIERSLEASYPDGSDFLEKIVQVGIDLPQIERTRLEKFLFSGLDEILFSDEKAINFDQKRWGNIFVPGLSPYFQSLRDVYRFLSTLSFHISLFRPTGVLEVNPIDLISLEVLRVFEPRVYGELPKNKPSLTQKVERSFPLDLKDPTYLKLENLINLSPEERHVQVREILKRLFPPAASFFNGDSEEYEEEWTKKLRVCDPDIFDRYFYLAIPEGDVEQAEIISLLSLVGERKNLVTEFERLRGKGLLNAAIDRLTVNIDQFPSGNILPFITAILDIGDYLPDSPPGSLKVGPMLKAIFIIESCLGKEKDAESRSEILYNAIDNTVGIYLPIDITINEEQKRDHTPEHSLAKKEHVEKLKQICLEKIKKAVNSDVLRNHPRMRLILSAWAAWTSTYEPSQWVKSMIESQDGLLSFLKAFIRPSASVGKDDVVPDIHERIYLKNIEEYVPATIIAEKIASIKKDSLSEADYKAIRAFERALKRKQEGRSDNDWRDDYER